MATPTNPTTTPEQTFRVHISFDAICEFDSLCMSARPDDEANPYAAIDAAYTAQREADPTKRGKGVKVDFTRAEIDELLEQAEHYMDPDGPYVEGGRTLYATLAKRCRKALAAG